MEFQRPYTPTGYNKHTKDNKGFFYSGIGTILLPAPTPTCPALLLWKSHPIAGMLQPEGRLQPPFSGTLLCPSGHYMQSCRCSTDFSQSQPPSIKGLKFLCCLIM